MAQKQPIRITTSQAANLFGINEKTVRRAIKDGDLLYIVVRGVYKINFDSLLKWSQTKIKVKNKFNNNGIGQYLDNEPAPEADKKNHKWKIKNKLYSPNPKFAEDIAKNDEENESQNIN